MATSQFASPLGQPRSFFYDSAGNPLSGGKINTYIAGTSTPLATYPTYADALAGTNPNANPVILDAAGGATIFLQATAYKITVSDSASVLQYTVDQVAPALGFPTPVPTEWILESNPIAFSTATQFKVTGIDRTATYTPGRRVKTVNTGGTIYGTVASSAFVTDTTVNVTNDSGSLDAGLSALSYGFASYASPSYLDPRTAFSAVKNGNQAANFSTSTKIITWTVETDPLSEWVAGSHRWVAKYGGSYLVTAQVTVSDTVASSTQVVQIYKNGVINAAHDLTLSANATVPSSPVLTRVLSLVAGDYLEVFIQALTGTSSTVAAQATSAPATIFNVVRIP